MRQGRSKRDGKTKSEGAQAGALQRVAWLEPYAVAFLASFCVMVVELVAGRLVARYLGASLYTWTSAIGVVLTGLALGNYVGGRLADRYQSDRLLSVLLILASVCCLLSLPLNRAVGAWDGLGSLSWPNHVAVHVTLIFLWPAGLLGTIAPVAAKMALDQGREMGRTVGSVYAWGAVGSIMGTFLTGYWFIAAIGSMTTIVLVSVVLAAMGVGFRVRSWLSRVWAGAVVGLGLLLICPWNWARAATVDLGLRERLSDRVVYSDESAYSFIRVLAEHDEPRLRSLTLDHLIHSWVFLGDPTRLQYDYERIYAAVTRVVAGEGKPIRTLFLGGGGYTFPRYVQHTWPGSTVDVAEIDPAVTAAARAGLGLRDDAPMRIRHLDARNYVEDLLRARRRGDCDARFDFVYGDVFDDYLVPWHLTTREFNEKLREVMTDRGVYMLNVIDVLAAGRLLGAVVNTLRRTFDHVWVFSSRTGLTALDPFSRDTFVVVASPADLGLPSVVNDAPDSQRPGTLLTDRQLAALHERSRGMVLTDDYAPVEHLLAPVYGHDAVAECRKLNAVGLALAMKGQYDRAANYYRRALRERPDFAEARSNLGWALVQQGQRERGLEMLRKAVEQGPSLASGHNNLGWALYQKGKHVEAIQAYRRALECEPNFALACNNLGLALAARGQIDQAVGQYREAIRIQPSFAEAYYNLGAALGQLGQVDDALEAYTHVLSVKPRHVEALNDVGWLLHKQGKHAEAEARLRAALKIRPWFGKALNNLGMVLAAQGRQDEAVGVYAKLLTREPGNVDACNNLGIVLERQSKTAEAARWFAEALKFQPDYVPARDNLLALYMRTGRHAEAVELLRKTLARTPDEPGILSNLAWILATSPQDKLRNGTEAVKLARQADELSAGRSPRAIDSLAAAYAETGAFDKAVLAARRALTLARSTGRDELAKAIEKRVALYQDGKPFRHSR